MKRSVNFMLLICARESSSECHPSFRHSGRRASGDPEPSDFASDRKALGYSCHPWRSPFGPPSAFAFAILQTHTGLRRNGEAKITPPPDAGSD
jgi:hypothetical protein